MIIRFDRCGSVVPFASVMTVFGSAAPLMSFMFVMSKDPTTGLVTWNSEEGPNGSNGDGAVLKVANSWKAC